MHIVFGVIGILLTTSVSVVACPLAESVYRDAEGDGFELIFGEPIPHTGSSDATATIHHRVQENLYQFTVGQASGYGSISLGLILLGGTEEDYQPDGFPLNFLDEEGRSANPLFLEASTPAPPSLFITNLGRYDYYRRRGSIHEDIPPPLTDGIWWFDRCQTP